MAKLNKDVVVREVMVEKIPITTLAKKYGVARQSIYEVIQKVKVSPDKPDNNLVKVSPDKPDNDLQGRVEKLERQVEILIKIVKGVDFQSKVTKPANGIKRATADDCPHMWE